MIVTESDEKTPGRTWVGLVNSGRAVVSETVLVY